MECVFTFQLEGLMMRSFVKMSSSLSAVAIVAMLASTALAGDLGLIVNGDMEVESRFTPHGTPGVDHPNGYADGWHHSQNSAWSGSVGGAMSVSPTHSLYIPDTRASDRDEMRSFATAIPGVGSARPLNLSWKWKWDITSAAGDKFSAFVRISKDPAGGLDLGGAITDHVYLTNGSASSDGFQMFMTSIPLAADDQSFDIIFRTTADPGGTQSELGTMFVDDVSAAIPEPATLGVMGLAGLGLMIVSRRRRG
jgi:hypothetical protein